MCAGLSLGATCIDLQCNCCDVTSISVRNAHKCVVKKNEHVCGRLETCVLCVCVCVCELARLQSSNPSQNRIAGGGEWPSSMFHETSPPYRISITSDDLLFFFPPPTLPVPPPPPFTPPFWPQYLCTSSSLYPSSFLRRLLSLSSVSSIVPLSSPSPTLLFLLPHWGVV